LKNAAVYFRGDPPGDGDAQPTTVKEALAYTPSVFSTRGASTTYDVVTIRGFTTSRPSIPTSIWTA
jgi:outer membrane receptor protein involved in Fe transport